MASNRSKQSALNVLTGFLESRNNYDKARQDMKMEMLKSAIKQRADRENEQFKAELPYKTYQKFSGQGGQPQGDPFFSSGQIMNQPNRGGSMENLEFTPPGTKRIGLKDMAERVYQKPQEQWTPSDKQIVGQYQAMVTAGKPASRRNPLDPDLTQQVLAKFIDPNKSDEDFALDLKDLKDNKALYEQAGVDVGEVFNQALKHKSVTPGKKSWIQKAVGAWNQLTGE